MKLFNESIITTSEGEIIEKKTSKRVKVLLLYRMVNMDNFKKRILHGRFMDLNQI